MARPNLSYLKNLFLSLSGLPAGLLTGLTGVGSSVVLVPSIRWLLGLRPGRAAATALAVTNFVALAGLLSYSQHGDVRWGLALLLTLGQIIGAGWGARLVERQPALIRLRPLWALLLVVGGLVLVAQGRGMFVWHPWLTPLPKAEFWVLACIVAVAVGLLSRLMELGGVLLIPIAVEALRLPPHTAQGTALVVLLLAALPAMLIYARRGDLEPQGTVWLSVGGVFGALIGAYWAAQIHANGILLSLYGLILILLGISLFWRGDPASEAV
jgi:uncharacterized membrane protein YfcA